MSMHGLPSQGEYVLPDDEVIITHTDINSRNYIREPCVYLEQRVLGG